MLSPQFCFVVGVLFLLLLFDHGRNKVIPHKRGEYYLESTIPTIDNQCYLLDFLLLLFDHGKNKVIPNKRGEYYLGGKRTIYPHKGRQSNISVPLL